MTEKIFEKRLDVVRYEQKLSYYCGAACSKMVLDKYDIYINQREAYNAIHNTARFPIEKMYSDPDGISEYLNHKTPNSIDFVVDDYSTKDAEEIIQRIFYTLSYLEMPVITLVDSGNHWVVIDGVRYTETTEGKRDIIGLYIKNPWFKTVSPIYQSADEFIKNKLRPNKWGSKWANKLVIISDQATSPLVNLPVRELQFVMAGGGGQIVPAQGILEQHGFIGATQIVGGGAAVYSDIEVMDLDGNHNYTISPLDALRTDEWKDFVYVAYSLSGKLLEVASFSSVLDFPDDDEVALLAKDRFNVSSIEIDPKYYYIESYFTSSRFDVYRKLVVDNDTFYLHRNGEFYEDPQGFRPDAGG